MTPSWWWRAWKPKWRKGWIAAATAEALRQIAGPVIATTLVLLAVFVPVALLPGIVGELYRQFAVTLSTAVTLSSLVALTLTPALCALLLRPRPASQRHLAGFNRGLDGARRLWPSGGRMNRRPGWRWRRRWRRPAGGVQLYLDAERLPAAGRSGLLCQRAAAGSGVAGAYRSGDGPGARAADVNPAVEDVIQVSGFNILNGTSASNGGFISVMLKDWHQRPPLDAVMANMQRQLLSLPEATIMTFAPPTLPGWAMPPGLTCASWRRPDNRRRSWSR
jgi:hypothetical protein